jgi:hypothetical protein
MFEFLRSKTFDYVFSFVIGLGLMALLKPGCRGTECKQEKAPSPDEVTKTTYQIGEKCYQFRVRTTDCPLKGVVEPFHRA